MKDLITATLIIVLLIGGWLAFYQYSEQNVEGYITTTKEKVIPAIESEDWQRADELLQKLNKEWHDYKKLAYFFLDTDTVNEIDYGLAKSIKYTLAEDVSNASGELSAMVEQMKFLIQNDEVNAANIF